MFNFLNKTRLSVIALILALVMLLSGCSGLGNIGGSGSGNGGESGGEGSGSGESGGENNDYIQQIPVDLTINGEKIPAYSGSAYYVVNGNTPFFTSDEITDKGYYTYTDLDSLGRCGAAMGCIGPETLPNDGRESISHIYPSGWKYNGVSNNRTYPTLLGGNTLYNRAHLLANQLVDKDVDVRNLITGTEYLNQKNMVDFENMVADFVKGGYGHVMYRVTPFFEGNNLVCSGVLMEGYSVEDEGDGVTFCVFLYNVQPGIEINYLTGENRLAGSDIEDGEDDGNGNNGTTDTGAEGLPEENTAYYLYAVSGSATYYFSGTINSKTMSTTTDKASAAKIYFESAGKSGSYYIYIMNGQTKAYLTMTSNSTKVMATAANASDATGWTVDVSAKQIVNDTYSPRAFAFYSSNSDIRTYAPGTNGAIWVWFSAAE